ncbi:MAG: Uma2 family endonuclease [Gemmataceae bacterium]|nr:Uma2 family endonuclease [Gemmataceae bacterium]
MVSATTSQRTTFEEFCELVKEGQKGDLIDGVIYMASPENTDANSLFMWLGGLMYDFAEVKKLGAVFGSRVAFRLDDANGPEPDIAFVRGDRVHLIKRGRVEDPPDLAVEIVSPDSVERDYEQKFAQYQKAGVHEYWIVDELEQKMSLYRLDRKGKYRAVRPKGGALRSQVLTDFWLRSAWLWQEPRPTKYDILKQLLGEAG